MNTKNLLIVVLFMLIPTLSLAWGTEINGIYYSFNTSDKTACVVSGHGVFADGVKLQYYSGDIVIPEEVTYEGITYKVTSIGGGRESRGMPYNDGAFEYSSITSIQIPKTIERIGEYTFQGCSSLATVSFDGNIKSIGIGAFKDCCSLVSFEIPEGVETLNYRTFTGCSSLESLTIPTTLKSSGYSGDFVKLKSLHIKDLVAWCNVSFYSSNENPLYYAHHLYLNGVEIKEFVIPQESSVVGNYVFSGCEGITSVEFHKDVERIGWQCFASCTNLETIIIKGSNTKIEEHAFHNCSKLKDIYCDTEKCPAIVRGYDFDESTYENATLHVKDYAVESFKADETWSKFKHIDVEKVTDFKLTYYVDGEMYKEYTHKYEDEINPEPNPTKKGHTFSGWDEIPETMPGKDVNVTGTFTWSKDTISGVIYQVTDTIHNYCSIIGNYMATGELIPVSNPVFDEKYLLISIEKGTFKNNTDITSVVVPDSVLSVGDNAFNGCKNVTTLGLNKYIEKIGERAFANIEKLTDVTVYAENIPETDKTAFENSYVDYATLHVPYGSVDKYKALGPWKDFKEIVAIEGTQRTFVLTYKVDGEVYKTYEIKEGETITPEAEPIKEGYTFSGWSDIPAVMPSEDLTITGTFTINKYKLTYIVDEKEYKVFEVEYNATITPVPAPEKEGYTFSGWSEIPEKMPAKDVTVTGAFTINKYKLLYMVDDTVYDESEVEYGAAITPLEAPAKEGYTFSGWSEIPETMPAKDVTVTGTFTTNKYKLTYMVDGEVYKTYDVEYGATVTPEAEPTKEGYTFSGWSTIPDTMPANDVTVTGSFTKGAYKLIYKIDGEVYKTYTYDFGAEITPEPAPEKEGYSFLGWSDIPEIMPANDVEVTGSFTVNKYNLIYKVDGDVYKEYEMEYGAEITPEEEPTKEGWEFSGWSWIPKKMPAEDVVIMGTFKQLDYAVDGGTFTIDDGEATLKGGGEAKGALVINNNVTINGKVYVVVNISNGAFKGNKDITSVELPDGIKNIGAGAFDGCSSLLKVLLGKGVKKIGSKAFGNIWKAAAMTRAAGDGFRVECNAESVPEIETDAFEGTEIEKATLVVKDELVNSYKTAEVWKNFGSIIGQMEATDIDGIFTDNPSAVIYSIDGRRLDKVQKGMNVIRTEKGVKKVVVR